MRIYSEVIDDEHNQVAYGHKRDETGVLERVKSPQECQRDDQKHERRDPEMTVN
jgi:hypothetical protein